MDYMFKWCASLESVPLLDTSSVEDMMGMFYRCKSLSKKTKQEWSSVYNFETNRMK